MIGSVVKHRSRNNLGRESHMGIDSKGGILRLALARSLAGH